MGREALILLVLILISLGLGYCLAVITLKPDEPLILQPRTVVAIDTIYRTSTRIRYIHDTVYAEVVDTVYRCDTLRIPLTLYWWRYKDEFISVKLRTVYLDSFSYSLNYRPRPSVSMLGLALDSRATLWLLGAYRNAVLGIGTQGQNLTYLLGIRWTF